MSKAARKDANADSSEARQCRMCMEEEGPGRQLVSPCRCTGSQQFIHLDCLQKWQAHCLKSTQASEKAATTCSVCKAKFSIGPPQPSFLEMWPRYAAKINRCLTWFQYGTTFFFWLFFALSFIKKQQLKLAEQGQQGEQEAPA